MSETPVLPESPTPVPQGMSSFLDSFNFKTITVAVIPQSTDTPAQVPSGYLFSPLNKVRGIPYPSLYLDSTLTELEQANASNCAIYFTLNEGDGIPEQNAYFDTPKGKVPNLNCGKRINIKTLKALAIDTDTADAVSLMHKLKEIHLLPHYIIETRPNRYHFYFFITPVKAEGDNILMWQSLQKHLSELVPDLDKTLTDINQLLRIPGFFNTKDPKPFRVRVFKTSTHPHFDLKQTFDRLNCSIHVPEFLESKTSKKFTFPEGPLSEGERRDTICKGYIEHILENILPLTASDEDYFTLIDAFIIKYVEDSHLFLEGGSRRKNIVQYFHDQRNRRLQLKYAKESQAAQIEFDREQVKIEKALPEHFYLKFPGDLGLWTRAIHEYTPTLPIEMAFASAVSIVGALKAESFRLNGAWPLLNGLIIAGTGVGKSSMKTIIETVLAKAGLRGKFPRLLKFQNTVQSLHTDLYTAGGVGTVLVDESGDYLETITSKNAPTYAKALKKYFKEATTGRNKGSFLHPGGSLSFQVPPIDGGFLSLWMFIQPDKFSQSLHLEDMADGFLPRFLIFKGTSTLAFTDTVLSEEASKEFEPSFDLTVWLETMSGLLSYSDPLSIQDVLAAAEADVRAVNPKAKQEQILIAQRDAMYRLRSEARNMKHIKVEMTEDAKNCVVTYLLQKQSQARTLSASAPHDPALGVLVRTEEMLLRLLCCASEYIPGGKGGVGSTARAVVTEETAKACIELYEMVSSRFLEEEVTDMQMSANEKELEEVLKAVKRACKKAGGAVRVREVILNLPGGSRRPKNVSALMVELVKRGDIWAQEREHMKASGRKVTVYLPAASEDTFE